MHHDGSDERYDEQPCCGSVPEASPENVKVIELSEDMNAETPVIRMHHSSSEIPCKNLQSVAPFKVPE